MAPKNTQAAKNAANTAAINAIQTQIAAAQNAANAGDIAKAQQLMSSLPSYTTVAAGGSARTQLQQAAAAVLDNIAAAKAPAQQQQQQPVGATGLTKEEVQALIDKAAAEERAAQKAYNDKAASAYLADLLTQYGLGELAGQVDSLIQQWGNNTGVVANQLRQTEPYKQRFAGLLSLQQKGINDIRNEAEYIAQESAYRKVFRDAGLNDYLGAAGSKDEIAAIAKLVGDYSVSVDEVKARVQDAQRVVQDTNAEVKNALQRYYNIAPGDLVAYTLDPSRQKNRINDMANAAVIGGYGQASGLNIGQSAAEKYANLYAGQDIQQTALTPTIQKAALVRNATGRLADIEGTSLSDDEALLSTTGTDQAAESKITGLQSRERARFSGSSGVNTRTLTKPNVF